MTFIQERSPRERMLLLIALVLLVCAGFWQFVLSPVLSAQESAQRQHSAAMRDYVIVRDGITSVGAATQSATGAPFERSAVLATARAVNLSISRLQPDDNGSIRVWLEDAQTAAVFRFLDTMTTDYAASIGRVQITRNNDGSVAAQITLQGAS